MSTSPRSTSASTSSAFILSGAAVSLVTLATSVIRGRFVAHHLGPEGVGVTAQVMQVVGLGLFASAVGTHIPLLRAFGTTVPRKDDAGVDAAFRSAFWVTAALHGLGLLVALVLAFSTLPDNWTVPLPRLVALAALASFFTTSNTIVSQYFVAIGRVREMAVAGVTAAVFATVLTFPLVSMLGIEGQFWTLCAGNGSLLLVSVPMMRRQLGRWPALLPPSISSQFIRDTFTLGAGTVVAVLLAQSTMTVVRLALAQSGGGDRINGFFQAGWAVASMALALVLQGHNTYFNVRFSSAENGESVAVAFGDSIRAGLRYVAPVVLGGAALADLVVDLLYSKEFHPAAWTLRIVLLTAPLRVIAWSFGSVLSIRGHLRAFLVSEFLAFLVGGSLTWLLVGRFGLVGAATGLFVQALLSLPYLQWVGWSVAQVRVDRRMMFLAFAVAVAGLAAAISVDLVPALRWGWLVGAVVLSWRLGVLGDIFARFRA